MSHSELPVGDEPRRDADGHVKDPFAEQRPAFLPGGHAAVVREQEFGDVPFAVDVSDSGEESPEHVRSGLGETDHDRGRRPRAAVRLGQEATVGACDEVQASIRHHVVEPG
jgi:hypothetical protein